MKFFLIFVVMNLSNPSDPSVLGHKLLNSKAECEALAKETPTPPANLRVATFCVSEHDMLEIKKHA